jgi:hypothetical protein
MTYKIPKWPLFTGALLILVGEFFPPPISFSYNSAPFDLQPILEAIFKNVGIAFFAAYVIASLIEPQSRKNLEFMYDNSLKRHRKDAQDSMDQLATNVLSAVYKRDIPDQVFHQVEKTIIQSNFVRSDFEVSYGIEYLDDKREYVACITHASFTIENISREDLNYDFAVEIEAPCREEFESVTTVETMEYGDQKLSEEQLSEANQKAENTEAFKKYAHAVPIKAGKSETFSVKYKMVKYSRDNESFRSLITSQGVKFRVTAPDDIKIHAVAQHPSSLVDEGKLGSTYRWKMQEVMLPYQGVVLWWEPLSISGD